MEMNDAVAKKAREVFGKRKYSGEKQERVWKGTNEVAVFVQ